MKNIIDEYPFVTVWRKRAFGVGKGQLLKNGYLCTIKDSLGFDKEVILSFDDHDHSEQFLAKVRNIDDRNLTGMLHLDKDWSNRSEENAKSLKSNFFGRDLIVEEAHWAVERRIYRSVYPVFEYWSDLELEIGEKIR